MEVECLQQEAMCGDEAGCLLGVDCCMLGFCFGVEAILAVAPTL